MQPPISSTKNPLHANTKNCTETSAEIIWSRCCDILASELPSQQFNTWIKVLQPVPNDVGTGDAGREELVLVAPNRFIKDWVESKYLPQLERTLKLYCTGSGISTVRLQLDTEMASFAVESTPRDSGPVPLLVNDSAMTRRLEETRESQSGRLDQLGPVTDIPDEIAPQLSFGPEDTFSGGESAQARATEAFQSASVVPSSPRRTQDNEVSQIHQHNILSRYRFDNFVEGKSNQLARAAAIQVVENPSGSYNPLFLYGGVGLGKTHLMHAVGNEIKRRNPGANVVYLHSERFVGDMVKALQLNAINDFKRYYRSVDALLIDDIQFFANKERSQEEFFHTFNALLEGGQQMIFSCDRYPKSITGVEERLKSRFGWGLTVHIEAPELETRVAILKRKAEQEGIAIPDESAFFLAGKVRANVRELEGALKRVNANAEFLKAPITVDLIKDSLKDLLALQDKMVTIDNIQRTAAEYFKIKIADLHSKRRNRSVARPRQVAMALAKELTQHSLPEIGDAFGGRDHTTVLHACKKVKELRETNADVSEDYHNLIRQLST